MFLSEEEFKSLSEERSEVLERLRLTVYRPLVPI